MSPSRKVLDARGLACPQPVILTRKALAEGGFSELEVIVNTSSGRENVARFAGHAGCTIGSIEESGEETRIVIQPPVTNWSDPTATESLPRRHDAPRGAWHPDCPPLDPDHR